MRADVACAGRTSILVSDLDIARVSEFSPDALFCGDFTGDTDGFSWFCSRHFAIKTDLGDDQAAGLLSILELAWPQYEALFGATPVLSAKLRLALVAGATRDSLRRAMIDDGMFAFTLGGVTQEGYGISYFYAGAPYQTRYIALHEATHLFQYCLSGNTRGTYGFFVEGVADYLSSHVFNPADRSLTVNVLDRAPVHNHLANGLAEWRNASSPSFSILYGDPCLSRPLSVLLTAFLQSTPEFEPLWHRYAKEVVACGAESRGKAFSDSLIADLYCNGHVSTNGNGIVFPRLDSAFASWMDGLSASFRLSSRDFDQEGDAFVSSFPASPESPAELECRNLWRKAGDWTLDWPHGAIGATPGTEEGEPLSAIRWRAEPEKGSRASMRFSCADGNAGASLDITVGCPSSSRTAYWEVNGRRDLKSSGRRLHSLLTQGVEFRLVRESPNGESFVAARANGKEYSRMPAGHPAFCQALMRDARAIGCTLAATQPGVEFALAGIGAGRGDVKSAGADTLATGMRFATSPAMEPTAPSAPKTPCATPIDNWLALGPFQLSRGGFCHPKAKFPQFSADSVHTLDDGTFTVWRKAAMNSNSAFSNMPVVNLTRTFGRQANDSFAYLATEIECDADCERELVMGVSDGIEVCVNGEIVLDDVITREWEDGNVRIPVKLRRGRNVLMLRQTHSSGVWLLSAGFE